MGYRSDVGIALGFVDYNETDNFVTAYKIKEPEFWEREVKGVWGEAEPHVLVAEYQSVKWMESDIYDMLEFATENFLCAWVVMKIGEELDDIETETGHCVSSENENGVDVAQDILSELFQYVDIQRRIYVHPHDKLI